ncbi:MAG: DUF6457 domain-containing protein [Actinomycetota bacterium]|nr:DUF6457 domain-containing protein [Actinomycetota bacterium]
MTTSAREWLAEFASGLGTPAPNDDELDELLALAGIAAHASERTAAPVSCWLVARAGCPTSEALALAKRIADSWSEDGE